jgi:predicted Mrr-cat superfamily restriction endonuclease
MQMFQMKSRPHDHDRLQQWLKEGFVNIGWPNLGDLTSVTKEELKERLSGAPYNYSGQVLANQLGTVSAFVHTMQAGDIVLVMENDGWVRIGRVGKYRYVSQYDTDKEGMCHQRPMEWLEVLPKDELNEEVRELLRNRGAVTKFKYPTEVAKLDYIIYFESILEGVEPHENAYKTALNYTEDDLPMLKRKALNVLVEALNSSDLDRRERAAMAILQYR